MKALRNMLGVWVVAAVVAAPPVATFAAESVSFQSPVNLSASPGPTDKARLLRLSYSDGTAFRDPYLVFYLDGPTGQENLYARRSFDGGLTWDGPTLLSHDAAGDPTGGQTIQVQGQSFTAGNGKPVVFAPGAGESVLVTWTSAYCPGLTTPGAPNGDQKIDTAVTPNQPYQCVWTARSTDAGASWTLEQVTDGARDAANVAVGGSQQGNAFALAWQEDPDGLQSGEGAGPGEGLSGSKVSPGTNIWYAYASILGGPDPVFRPNGVTQVSNNDSQATGAAGASRPALNVSGPTVALAYEETKGGGGKAIIYHSFRFNAPDHDSGGLVASDPAMNARRPRLVVQGDSQAGASPVRVLLLYRQSELTVPDAASDIILQRGLKDTLADPASTGFRPADLEPYTLARDLSDTGPDDNARAHRAILRGAFIALGYTHTADQAAADPAPGLTPTRSYNFYVRTSTDAGATWSAPRDLSNISDPGVTVIEPRLVPTPGANPASPNAYDQSQDTAVYYAAWGTAVNDAAYARLRIYVTRSADGGAGYAIPTPVASGSGQSEIQLRAVPDGSAVAAVWMQQEPAGAEADALFSTASIIDVPDVPADGPTGLTVADSGGGCALTRIPTRDPTLPVLVLVGFLAALRRRRHRCARNGAVTKRTTGGEAHAKDAE